MTSSIWKFPLPPYGFTDLEVPEDAEPLTVGVDLHGNLAVWFAVDPSRPFELRRLEVVFTGDTIVDSPLHTAARYVGSVSVDRTIVHVLDFGQSVDRLDLDPD